MSATIEVDLKEILAKLEGKIDSLAKDVSEIKTEVKVLQQQVINVENKINNVEKRLDGQAFWLRSVGGGLTVAALLAILKMLGLIDTGMH